MTPGLFASIVLIHLAAAISPGPSFVVALRTAATEGFRVAVALAIGFGLGALLWAAAAMAGLAVLFRLVPSLFLALKLAGAGFLFYIAYMMWSHAKEPLSLGRSPDLQPRSAFSAAARFGFLTFATNPKPAVFFGAVFVGLLPAEMSFGWRLAILSAIFLNETLWYILVARVFSLRKAREAYLKFKVWIDRAFGSLLVLLGLKIALT
jgi:threonine/homoserine/homoserine lactone efflux protein